MHLAFAATAFQTQLAYRRQVWTSVFGYLIQVFARIAIWNSVIGIGAVAGVSLADMVTYTVVAMALMMALDYSQLISSVGNAVKTGDIAVYLLKPLRYPLYLFSVEAGNLFYRLLAVVLPVAIVTALVYGLKPPASLLHAAMFLGFYVTAFAILFLLSVLCGLLAFWILTAFSLEWFLQGILAIFSGTFIPLWFFPEWLAAAVRYLPFAWVGYYPAAVYLGKLDAAEAAAMLALGCCWAGVLALAVALLWRRATLRIVVQGG